MLSDKYKECGCHEDCTWLVHHCEKPCSWPNCLTEAEHRQLLVDLHREEMGDACLKSPSGEHEDVEFTDPSTGLPFTSCRHCGRAA
jgi:hypothetical protein